MAYAPHKNEAGSAANLSWLAARHQRGEGGAWAGGGGAARRWGVRSAMAAPSGGASVRNAIRPAPPSIRGSAPRPKPAAKVQSLLFSWPLGALAGDLARSIKTFWPATPEQSSTVMPRLEVPGMYPAGTSTRTASAHAMSKAKAKRAAAEHRKIFPIAAAILLQICLVIPKAQRVLG